MSTATETMTGPTEYVAFWNDTLADKFDRYRDILKNGLSYHSRVPLDTLSVEPGARIVDVGCGWGDTAIELARRTGPDGFVLGLDCVEQFLETARADAEAAGVEFPARAGTGRRGLPRDRRGGRAQARRD